MVTIHNMPKQEHTMLIFSALVVQWCITHMFWCSHNKLEAVFCKFTWEYRVLCAKISLSATILWKTHFRPAFQFLWISAGGRRPPLADSIGSQRSSIWIIPCIISNAIFRNIEMISEMIHEMICIDDLWDHLNVPKNCIWDDPWDDLYVIYFGVIFSGITFPR